MAKTIERIIVTFVYDDGVGWSTGSCEMISCNPTATPGTSEAAPGSNAFDRQYIPKWDAAQTLGDFGAKTLADAKKQQNIL